MSEIPDDIWEAARGLRDAVCWQSNSAVEFIAKALNAERVAAEQRGREMAAQTCNGISAGFMATSQAPDKSEDEAKLLQVMSEAFADCANLIRFRTTEG